jgi:hypothetical protein
MGPVSVVTTKFVLLVGHPHSRTYSLAQVGSIFRVCTALQRGWILATAVSPSCLRCLLSSSKGLTLLSSSKGLGLLRLVVRLLACLIMTPGMLCSLI